MGILDDHNRDKARREDFLKDKSPMDVLLWIMRSGDAEPRLQADIAIALLPYMHAKKGAIDPADDKPEG